MSRLRPAKLHVRLGGGVTAEWPVTPRCYTLTHSDGTGDLFLTIGREYDRKQIRSSSRHYRRRERWGTPADYRLEGT
jgi:hypothetical protein